MPLCQLSGSVYGTACDADGRRGTILFALHRRGVRDCCRCIDDDLRRRHHGRRQAGRRCLDVSVATSRSIVAMVEVHTAAWRTLQWLYNRSVSTVVQQAQCNTSMLQRGFGVALRDNVRATSALRYATLQQLFFV